MLEQIIIFNPLNPREFYMYHLLEQIKPLHSATQCICVFHMVLKQRFSPETLMSPIYGLKLEKK
jgi:hypothetical protein